LPRRRGINLPLYPYHCTKCDHRFEKIQKFGAKPEEVCPKCGGALERTLTAPGLNFKGAGWYVNDYAPKSSGSGGGSGSSSSSGTESSSAEKKAGGETKSESKTESKAASGGESGSSSSTPAAPATGSGAATK
jgi:putative FmdB family regulatory protein